MVADWAVGMDKRRGMDDAVPFCGEAQRLLGEAIVEGCRLRATNFVDSFRIETARGSYFLKCLKQGGRLFFCEAHGIEEIARSRSIGTVGLVGATDHILILEFIDPVVRARNFFEDFGAALARMHRHTSSECGFYEDNFLGASRQPNLNPRRLPWPDFFWQKRLLYQCRIGVGNGLIGGRLEEEILALEPVALDLLRTKEPPSLLHGDLWSGNFMVDTDGRACLIDPAVYYGNREAELAMMRLFGGFPPEFFQSYEKHFPLEEGADRRLRLYQLYHLLNHLNLFGRGYLGAVEEAVGFYTNPRN